MRTFGSFSVYFFAYQRFLSQKPLTVFFRRTCRFNGLSLVSERCLSSRLSSLRTRTTRQRISTYEYFTGFSAVLLAVWDSWSYFGGEVSSSEKIDSRQNYARGFSPYVVSSFAKLRRDAVSVDFS